MNGADYRQLVAAYIFHNFSDRHLRVYTEVGLGTTIIGKNRRVDILVICSKNPVPLAVECKWQDSPGTTDEKIPYALQDLAALRVPGCLVYGGTGFSKGVLHLLRSSHLAAYCLPNPKNLDRGASGLFQTWELDHALAATFGWWDLLIASKNAFDQRDLEAAKSLAFEDPEGRPAERHRAAKRHDGSEPLPFVEGAEKKPA